MTDTSTEHSLYWEHHYEGNSWHHDGTYKAPRVSNVLADLVAGEWDVTDFRNHRKPFEICPDPKPDVRERAEFLFGLSELLAAMFRVGWVEHTGDWDWYVQVQTTDGTWYGDYYKDGVFQDSEDIPDDEFNYCDNFRTEYNSDTFQQLGIVPEAQEYYANLEIVLISYRGEEEPETRLKVGDVAKIIINQR